MYETLESLRNTVQIPLVKISRSDKTVARGDPNQDDEIADLMRNIKNNGLLNPITVAIIRGTEENEDTKRYTIVTGNRRYEAIKRLDIKTIKAFVLPFGMTAPEHEMLTLSENMLRKNYTPEERARIIQLMLESWGGDSKSLAQALGYSSARMIDKWLSTLNLDPATARRIIGTPAQIQKRSELVAKLPVPSQGPTVDILNEKNPSDNEASVMVTAIRRHPTVPPREVVENLLSQPQRTTMQVGLNEKENEALELACAKARLTKPALIEKIIGDYLRDNGFLQQVELRISASSSSSSPSSSANQ